MLPRNKILFIILSISFFFPLYPQVLRNIDVKGNRVFDKDEIISWSGLQKGMRFYPSEFDSAKILVAGKLAQQGYFNADLGSSSFIITEDSSFADVTFYISEGDPAVVRNIYLQGADSTDLSSYNMFYFLRGQVFSKSGIEESINNWLGDLENTGFPFARARIISVHVINDSSASGSYADITLFLDRGLVSRISKIEISGNTSTKDYVIVRELRLNKDQVYSQQQVEEFPKRLNRLRFFEPVATPDFYLNKNNEGVLLINVKEKQTNNFDGVVGYMPGDETRKGYFTGIVNINLRNLFGTGRAAAVRWQQYDRYSQEIELRYLEPWIMDYPFNITAGVFQRKQDTTYIQRRLEGAIEFLATEDISASLSLSTERVIPSINSVSRFTVYNSNAVTTGINLKIDTRDDPYAPTSGLLLFNTYSFSRKKLYGPQEYFTTSTLKNFNLQRITADFSFFYQLFTRQVAAFGIHGRELRGSFFEQSDLFRLGGTNTLRGYRENQFLGSRIFWSNLEYRLLLSRRTYAFLFYDTGYYLRNENPQLGIPKNEAFKTGYGAGINLETGIGVLAVSYALAAGDRFSEGKIHFGIINEF